MTPRLSIVIPTHNRRDILPRTLGALARQTAAPAEYEVIVVADGCTDDTGSVVQSLSLPYAVRVIDQPAGGAAAARNRGTTVASAPLVLFLDDDMEADPQLVAAHLQAHQVHPGGVVLGYFRPSLLGQCDDLPGVMVNLWWAERFAEMADPEHRFTFLDLFTGNVSMPRAAFDAVGGFDEQFHGRAGEDYELGLRLLKRRVPLRFVREASATHHDTSTTARGFTRARAEGRGHVVMARKHPDACTALPLRWLLSEPPPHGLRAGLRPRAAGRSALLLALRAALAVAEALKLRRVWKNLHGVAHSCAYWEGVINELGSWAAVERFAQEMPLTPWQATEADVDVQTDLASLEAILSAAPADALRLRYGQTALGRIPAVAGAEPLRAPHVHHALAEWFGRNVLMAIGDRTGEAPA